MTPLSLIPGLIFLAVETGGYRSTNAINIGELRFAKNIENFVVANDYPSRALRAEIEGDVRILALFSPEGKIVYSTPVGQANSDLWDSASR
ncbi:MAG: hypothetical protein ACKOPO_04830, partial [Novosphingobium sp.]